jgi:hypothetical protein
MNIYGLSVKSEIPLAKLRKLERLGALKLDGETGFIDALIFHMRGNSVLSVAQLLALIEAPDLLDELGAVRPRYASRAQDQIHALGDMSQAMAPRDVTAAIPGAARGDDDESLKIADWLKLALPAAPVSHAWVTVRLLKPLNEFMRGQTAPLISPALLNMRKLPEFAGYWHSEKSGARSVIKYFSPIGRSALDL